MSVILESILVALVIGGIMGAITALHLSEPKKLPLKIRSENYLKRSRH